jgi:DNA-binding NtrC family response regulator
MSDKPKILIVDDEERFRLTLAKMLTAQGLEVAAVEGGREALEELDRQPCDVIILDLRMPEMDGIEALAEIKKGHPEIEVIVLTGHASVDAAMEIIKGGGYYYLLKPYPIEELMEKIEAAYERKVERQQRLRQKEKTEEK